MSGTEAKNLEAISRAIDQHNKGCEWPAVAIEMNPFEVERLGWDSIRGLPVRGNPELGTGRFRVVCALSLTIDTFCPTSALTSVLLPTFGRPTTATMPARKALTYSLLRNMTFTAMSSPRGLSGRRPSSLKARP